jgi:hypothetical protein
MNLDDRCQGCGILVASLKRKGQSKEKKEVSKSGFHDWLRLKIKNKLTSTKEGGLPKPLEKIAF